MGQKVHPEGFRVGYIHDWKSNWFNEREFADYLFEDIKIREHIEGKLGHAGLSDIRIRKDKNEVTVDIHTARPGIVIGKSGERGRRAAARPPQDDVEAGPREHPRGEAPRAGREARRAVDRGAAPEPSRVPAGDEARADVRDALGRDGRAGAGVRAAGRRGDGAHRGLLGGSRAAAHAARGHRLRACTRPAPLSAASASSAGSTRARSCPRATSPRTAPRHRSRSAGAGRADAPAATASPARVAAATPGVAAGGGAARCSAPSA